MTRKDYVAIANAIAEVRGMDVPSATVALQEVQFRLAEVFAEENPRFDTARFLAACMGR